MSEIIKKGPDALITPYGGELKELLLTGAEAEELRKEAHNLPPIVLTGERQMPDLELLVTGGLSPLGGFMHSEDYRAVVEDERLANGQLWPIPIILDVEYDTAANLKIGGRYGIRQGEGNCLGVITVEDIYKPDKRKEARAVYGTDDPEIHPGVNYLLHKTNPIYVGGPVQVFQLPRHYTYEQYRLTPQQVREEIKRRRFNKVVAFQTRNPTHRAHFEIMRWAMEITNACLLFHPTVGPTKGDDVESNARMPIYIAVAQMFPDPNKVILAILPKAMRFACPREALWDAIIRRNYGATHLVVGRDHAGTNNFYPPFLAQQTAKQYQEELGIQIVEAPEMVYVEEEGKYVPVSEARDKGYTPLNISGTALREMIRRNEEVPSWFTFPEVIQILRRTMTPRTEVSQLINQLTEILEREGTISPLVQKILDGPTCEPQPNNQRGFILWLTGLSGSGKTTIAKIVEKKLLEIQLTHDSQRPVTVLDGDLLRHTLSKGLGFSREDRDENVLRVAYLAVQVAGANEAVLCPLVSPYRQTRDKARAMAEKLGVGFIEILVTAPFYVLVERDVKGLYQKALGGEIKNFTGVDSPYEQPENPELTIDTTQMDEEQAAELIINYLMEEGYLKI